MADEPSQYPALKWVRLGPGQGKEEGRGVRMDVEIVSNSSEVETPKALDAWHEKPGKKGLKREGRAGWGSGGKGATGPETYCGYFSSIRCCTN